jgi:hypothetical protein
VLYSGDESWTAAREIGELVESVPGGLDQYRPQMRYLLLEERGYPEAELAPMRNMVAALFRLENSRGPEDVIRVVETLVEWLQAPEQADLARALVVWLRRSLLAGRMPDVEIPEIENSQEARAVSAERVKDWNKQWRKEGWDEGRQEGESTFLARLLERKFGVLDAETPPRIAAADSVQRLS